MSLHTGVNVDEARAEAQQARTWALQTQRDALRAEGFDAPGELMRDADPLDLWLSPDLLIGETCSHPLATVLSGRVRYVATPVHRPPGCGRGTYRSAIIRTGRQMLAAAKMVPEELQRAAREYGVPEHVIVAIVGVDNDEMLCAFATPPLSSVDIRADRIGYEAAATLEVHALAPRQLAGPL